MAIMKVTISKTGQVVIEGQGFSGSSCVEASKKLEASIGGTAKRTLKSDFYETEETTQQHQTLRW